MTICYTKVILVWFFISLSLSRRLQSTIKWNGIKRMRLIVSLRYSRTCLSIKHWGGSVSTINLLQCQHSKIINDNIKCLFFNLLYTHFDPGVDPSFLGDTYFWKCEDALPVIQVSICLPNGHFKIFWNIALSSNLNKIKLSPIS